MSLAASNHAFVSRIRRAQTVFATGGRPMPIERLPSPATDQNGLRARPPARAVAAKSFAAKRFRYAVEVVGTGIMMASFLILALLG